MKYFFVTLHTTEQFYTPPFYANLELDDMHIIFWHYVLFSYLLYVTINN